PLGEPPEMQVITRYGQFAQAPVFGTQPCNLGGSVIIKFIYQLWKGHLLGATQCFGGEPYLPCCFIVITEPPTRDDNPDPAVHIFEASEPNHHSFGPHR